MAAVCRNNQRMISVTMEQYRLENGRGVQTWDEVVGTGKMLATMPVCPKNGTYSADYDDTKGYVITCDADHLVETRVER